MTVNYSVIGTGYFGGEQPRFLASIDGARVVAVYDPHHAQAVADEVGADVAESLDALLSREDIQAVVISSLSGEHHDAAIRAAAAGKEIFCEKPIALSYGQCAEMVEAARAAGVSFMAGLGRDGVHRHRGRLHEVAAGGPQGVGIGDRPARRGRSAATRRAPRASCRSRYLRHGRRGARTGTGRGRACPFMIIDTLSHRHRYTGVPGLSEMLDAMAELDDSTAPGTRLELGDDIGTVNVAEFTSLGPAVQTRFEAHRRFIDVHMVQAGEELLDVAALDALTVATEFDEGSDIGFHDGERTVSVTLRPG